MPHVYIFKMQYIPDILVFCDENPGICIKIFHNFPTMHTPSLYCDVKSQTTTSENNIKH